MIKLANDALSYGKIYNDDINNVVSNRKEIYNKCKRSIDKLRNNIYCEFLNDELFRFKNVELIPTRSVEGICSWNSPGCGVFKIYGFAINDFWGTSYLILQRHFMICLIYGGYDEYGNKVTINKDLLPKDIVELFDLYSVSVDAFEERYDEYYTSASIAYDAPDLLANHILFKLDEIGLLANDKFYKKY